MNNKRNKLNIFKKIMLIMNKSEETYLDETAITSYRNGHHVVVSVGNKPLSTDFVSSHKAMNHLSCYPNIKQEAKKVRKRHDYILASD